MNSQEVLDKQWFYNRARTCPIIHRCIMEHEHNELSWNATLALMARLLSESNENKSNQISKLIMYSVVPIMEDK